MGSATLRRIPTRSGASSPIVSAWPGLLWTGSTGSAHTRPLYLIPADHRRLRELAIDCGVSMQTLLLDAIDLLMARQGQGMLSDGRRGDRNGRHWIDALPREAFAETTKIEAFNDFLDRASLGGPVIKGGDPAEQEK
jgi:hypothetical protein